MHAWGTIDSPSWNSPSWSISAEWFAYLLFPAMVPLLAQVRSRVTAFALGFAVLGLGAAVLELAGAGFNVWVGWQPLVRVGSEFTCGAMLARGLMLNARPLSGGDWIGGAALAGFLMGMWLPVSEAGLVGLLAAFVLGAATATGWLASFLSLAPVIWLGKTSYSLYMTHAIALTAYWRLAEKFEAPLGGVTFCFSVALMLVAAAIMFYVVEEPARRNLQRMWPQFKAGL
jgi:peptidoglycan/LPS O-acetylase OafA/YrhL